MDSAVQSLSKDNFSLEKTNDDGYDVDNYTGNFTITYLEILLNIPN